MNSRVAIIFDQNGSNTIRKYSVGWHVWALTSDENKNCIGGLRAKDKAGVLSLTIGDYPNLNTQAEKLEGFLDEISDHYGQVQSIAISAFEEWAECDRLMEERGYARSDADGDVVIFARVASSE